MLRVDSRKIEKGDVFVALRGVDIDGHKFIDKAILNGASKIICEEGTFNVPTVIVENTRDYLINYLKEKYSEELKKIKIIGITGTNGKTTTAFLIHKALNKLGKKCGYIGTIGFYIDEKVRPLNNTTPDVYDLFEIFMECINRGCNYVVMEVSSQGLAYKRVEGFEFDYAIFTNLTQDHLDYHKTMENYALAKQELFKKIKKCGKAIINYDDEYKNYYLLSDNNNITYGFLGGDYQITNFKMSNQYTTFSYDYNKNHYDIKSPLLGKYNVYNLLVTIIILLEEGFNYEQIKNLLENLKAPSGRMESINYKTNSIIVDYAHTPDAMSKIINTMLEVTEGNVYVVFGCTGDRDRTKRSIMSNIACSLSKYVIMTHDDPHFESQEQIYEDMTKDLDKNNYEIVKDRKDAIIKGINLLKDKDTLLILGKGHEEFILKNGEKIPFNDLKVVSNYINNF